MGKPTPITTASSDDAFSLHSQPDGRYYDQDAPELSMPDQNDDLPPLYDEAAEASGGYNLSAPLLSESSSRLADPFRRDESITYYLDPRLDNDPAHLENHLRLLTSVPPRPFVRLHGYHRERRRDHDGKKKDNNVTDFDIQVELTPHLFADPTLRHSWHEIVTVENGEKAKRGGVFPRRARGFRKGNDGGGRVELGMVEKPNLTQWCHMYCASHSGMKTFRLKRRVIGFDSKHVREQLESMVRRTNYRGHVHITFPVHDETVEVWNDCRINRWRLTRWIYLFFCVSMLWLFTWPYLFFRTKKFETVSVDWDFSKSDGEGRKRYISISEDQWYNLWGRAIAKAVMSKRQGILQQQDLLAAEGAPPDFDTGNSTVNGALGFLRAGVTAMNEVNRQLGWGEDEF